MAAVCCPDLEGFALQVYSQLRGVRLPRGLLFVLTRWACEGGHAVPRLVKFAVCCFGVLWQVEWHCWLRLDLRCCCDFTRNYTVKGFVSDYGTKGGVGC